MSLLWIGSASICLWLLWQSTFLFNKPTCVILLTFNRPPALCSNDESNLATLINRHLRLHEDVDTHKNILLYL